MLNVPLRSAGKGAAADSARPSAVRNWPRPLRLCTTTMTYVSMQDTGRRVKWSHLEPASPTKRRFFLVARLPASTEAEKTTMNKKWKSQSLSAILLAIVAVAGLGGFLLPNQRHRRRKQQQGPCWSSKPSGSQQARRLRLEHRGRSPPSGHRGCPEGSSNTERRDCLLSARGPDRALRYRRGSRRGEETVRRKSEDPWGYFLHRRDDKRRASPRSQRCSRTCWRWLARRTRDTASPA